MSNVLMHKSYTYIYRRQKNNKVIEECCLDVSLILQQCIYFQTKLDIQQQKLTNLLH